MIKLKNKKRAGRIAAFLFAAVLIVYPLTDVVTAGTNTAGAVSSASAVKKDSNTELLPSALGLFGGMCAGFAYTMVRILGKKGENGSLIVFFFSGFSCITMLPFLIFDFHPMSLFQLLMLLGAGLSAAGGQFSITAAYCHAPAKEISVYDYSQIIFATMLGLFILGEMPDLLSIAGYLIIITAAILMFMYNNKKGFFAAKNEKKNTDSK